MKNSKPTLKELKKKPALFWDETNSCPRMTMPDGTSLIPDKDTDPNWAKSIFTIRDFQESSPYRKQWFFIGWL